MKESRRKQMQALIAQRKTISMEELRDIFQVSMNTIRSDVAYLVDSGAAEKVYGGVRILQEQKVPLFTQRAALQPDAKKRIARYAETLIQDQDILYIDPGSTTMHLVDSLEPSKHVTIITGNIYVITQTCFRPNIQLIVLPGALNQRTNSMADVSTLEFLGRYHFAKAFMGVSGISPNGKLNVSTYIEYELKKLAVQQSLHTYLLADASKFGQESLMAYGSLEDMEEVITDAPCPDPFQEICRKKNVRLTLVEQGGPPYESV